MSTRMNKHCLIALSLIFVSVWASLSVADELRLKSSVDCSGPELHLGELLVACPAGLPAGKVVGRSPAPGESRPLSRRRLERVLLDLGWRNGLLGPENATLRSPGVDLDLDRLKAPVRARAEELLAERGYVLSGELSAWPASLRLSSGNTRWNLLLEREPSGRNAVLRLELEDRAGFRAAVRLRCSVGRPALVPVAAAPAKPGQALDSWVWQEKDVLLLDGEPLSAEEIEGAVARRYLKTGDALTRRNSAPAPMVIRGREVVIRLERGAVRISMTGIAQKDGALGDVVSVRHLDTRQLRRYRVTGPGTVAPAYLAAKGDDS